jgi:hypothetical protein
VNASKASSTRGSWSQPIYGDGDRTILSVLIVFAKGLRVAVCGDGITDDFVDNPVITEGSPSSHCLPCINAEDIVVITP